MYKKVPLGAQAWLLSRVDLGRLGCLVVLVKRWRGDPCQLNVVVLKATLCSTTLVIHRDSEHYVTLMNYSVIIGFRNIVVDSPNISEGF